MLGISYEYIFNNDCWFKGFCEREKNVGCDSGCPSYIEMHYLMNTSNIPERYKGIQKLVPQNCDYETFKNLGKIKSDIINFVKSGEFLYIHGNLGTGKSAWAIKLMQAYIGNIHIGNQFQDRCWFDYIPSINVKLKDFTQDDKRAELLKALHERDLVILDDIGMLASTNFDATNIASVINYRYSNKKTTIFTSNVQPDDLIKNVDVRLVDRILSGYVMELKGIGLRGKGGTYP